MKNIVYAQPAQISSKKNAAYPELTQFLSTQVQVINNYHGFYPRSLPASIHTVIYACFGEALHTHQLVDFLTCFQDRKCIIVTPRKYSHDLEQQFGCKIFCVLNSYAQYVTQIPEIDPRFNQRVFKKKFLSLNNRAQWDRQALLQFLTKFNLRNHFYFSYHCHDRLDMVGSTRAIYDQCNDIIGSTWYNQGLDLEMLYNELPISAGLDQFVDNDWGAGNPKYYWTSFASIVNETYTGENFNVFFTEKAMKPLAYGHPFMMHCSAGALAHLRDLGFQTFDNVFDEQHDTNTNLNQRVEHVFREINRICQLSDYDVHDLYLEARPRAEFNRDFFYNDFRKNYQKEITEVCDNIRKML